MSRAHRELRDPVEAALAEAIGAAGLAGSLPVNDKPSRTIRKRDIAIAALVLLISIISFAIVTAGWLASYKPDWWSELPDASAAPIISTAEAVEHGVTQAIDKMPSDGTPWRVELAESEANAWLASKLPKWIAHEGVEWPGGEVIAGIHFETGRITFGFELNTEQGGRVITATGRPHIDEKGRIVIRESHLGVGRLSLPAPIAGPPIAGWIDKKIPDEQVADSIMEVFAHGAPVIRDPSVEMGSSRTVRLVDIEVREQRLIVTCVTNADPRD